MKTNCNRVERLPCYNLFVEGSDNMSGATALMIGTFIGTYTNNARFRAQVDKGIQTIIGGGVDALNKLGGGIYVPNGEPVSVPDEEPGT